MTLDGFIAGPKGDLLAWADYQGVEYGFDEFLSGIGCMIEGKGAYDVEIENGWESFHSTRTIVMTHNTPSVNPNEARYIFIDGTAEEIIFAAKNLTPKNIWVVGGANVSEQFLSANLIDEIIVTITPKIINKGIHLFEKLTEHINLEVAKIDTYDKGLVQINYRVIK